MLKMEYGCNWGRLCESCRVSASTLYCHTDSAYLCCSCDERIHVMGSPCWPHHRVRICGACENAPAAFTCKADDASLCINCDFEIHSANPIASRHNRAPVSPLSQVINDTVTTTTETNNNNDNDNNVNNHDVVENNNNNNKEMDEREADSWLLLDSEAIESQVVDDGFMFGEAEDHHHQHHYDGGHVGCGLECDSTAKFQNFQEHHHDQQTYSFSEDRMNESDSVVPVQSVESQPQQQQQHQQQQQQQQNMYFNMEHDPSKMAFTNYPPNRPTVGVSYMEGHVNYRFSRDESYVWKCPNSSNANAIGEMNRKAGVEKYREKKKSRKFEKRIRYAYRKAYAEKRPRVKGRFAKRQDLASSHSQQPPHQLPSSHLIN